MEGNGGGKWDGRQSECMSIIMVFLVLWLFQIYNINASFTQDAENIVFSDFDIGGEIMEIFVAAAFKTWCI